METPFCKLKDHIASMRNLQQFTIARLAMKNPNNLASNRQFQLSVKKFGLLDALLDRAEELEAEEAT